MAAASYCKFPGCYRPQYVEHGLVHDFCGKTHAESYRKQVYGNYGTSSTSFTSKAFSSEPSRKGRLQPIKAFASNMFSKGPINFYSRSDPYYQFTNFYHAPIELDGHQWPTTEHYFQAQKFVGTPYYDHIRTLPTPREAFQVSRLPQASEWVRGDWPSVKDRVMLKALRAKFTQDKRLKQLLLDTKDRKLVEHTTNDSYWGDGGDGSGQNQLGKLLMQVRSEIKDTPLKDSSNKVPAKPRGLKRSSSFSNVSSVSSVSSPSSASRDDSDFFLSKPRQTHIASPMSSRKFTPQKTTASQYNYRHSSPSYSQVVSSTFTPSSNYRKPVLSTGASTGSFYGNSSYVSAATLSLNPRGAPSMQASGQRHLPTPPVPTSSSQHSSKSSYTNKSSVDYNIISHRKY